MFRKLFESKGGKQETPTSSTPHPPPNSNSGNSSSSTTSNSNDGNSGYEFISQLTTTFTPYDQWLGHLMSGASSASVQKLKGIWQDFSNAKTEKEKISKLNKVLPLFVVLCEQKKVDPRILNEPFGSNRLFGFAISRRIGKDLKDMWRPPKQMREQSGRLALFYFATVDNDVYGFELLYTLERLVAHEVNFDPLIEAGLPSTLAKFVHLLFSVPSSLLDAGDTIVDRIFAVITQLITKSQAATDELVHTDSLHSLFTITTIECSAPPHRKLRDGVTTLVVSLVKTHTSLNTAKYLSNKGVLQNLIFDMANYSNFTPDGIVTLCRLMLEIIKESISVVSGLLDDFVNAGGFTFWLHTLLRLENVPAPVQSNTGPTKEVSLIDAMLDVVCDMVYIGPSPLPPPPAESSYSNTPMTLSSSAANFQSTMPDPAAISLGAAGPLAVRNISAFSTLQNYFLKSSNSSCRIKVLDRLLSVFAANPVNFFLIRQLHTLALFIEDFESYPLELREAVLRVVLFIVTVVNCIPFQELSSLSCLLQDNPSSSTLLLILNTITKLVNFDHRYKVILRESGLLDMLIKLLQKGHEQLKEEKAAGAKPSTGQKPQLDSYAIVIDCISVLTEGVPENMSILRDWGCIDWLMEMIQHVVTRAAALRLILQTIKLDTSLENSHGDLAALVRILQSSPKSACSLKKDILNTIRRAFTLSRVAKDMFRETGGFVSLVSVLVGFEGDFIKDQNVDVNEALGLLEAVFKTATAAISQHPNNKHFFEEHIGYATLSSAISMMGILTTPYAAQVIYFLFDMAFENVAHTHHLQHTPTLSTTHNTDFEKMAILNRDAIWVILEILPQAASPKLHFEVVKKLNLLAMGSRLNRDALSKLGIPHIILTKFRYVFKDSDTDQTLIDTETEEIKERKELRMQLLQLLHSVGTYSLTSTELQEIFRLLQSPNAPLSLLQTLNAMTRPAYNPSYFEFTNSKTYAIAIPCR